MSSSYTDLSLKIFQNCLDMKTFNNVMEDKPSSDEAGVFIKILKFVKRHSRVDM